MAGQTVLGWLDRREYSHLQWWYSSLWHFPTEMTSLMVLLLSKALFLFCPVHCVEETPQQVSHCLSNIFNPIYCSHMSHSVACLFGHWGACAHTHTDTHLLYIHTFKCIDLHTEVFTHAQLWTEMVSFIDCLSIHASVKIKAWGKNKRKCKVGAQRLSFLVKKIYTNIKMSLLVLILLLILSVKDTGGFVRLNVLIFKHL